MFKFAVIFEQLFFTFHKFCSNQPFLSKSGKCLNTKHFMIFEILLNSLHKYFLSSWNTHHFPLFQFSQQICHLLLANSSFSVILYSSQLSLQIFISTLYKYFLCSWHTFSYLTLISILSFPHTLIPFKYLTLISILLKDFLVSPALSSLPVIWNSSQIQIFPLFLLHSSLSVI